MFEILGYVFTIFEMISNNVSDIIENLEIDEESIEKVLDFILKR
jgi:hypothetical protein